MLFEGMFVLMTFNKDGDAWVITGPKNTAKITMPDIGASNGVVHIIDTVLLPADPSNTTNANNSTTGGPGATYVCVCFRWTTVLITYFIHPLVELHAFA